MARYALVDEATGIIGEVRSDSDALPSYIPAGCQWVDVSSSTLSDQAMQGATWNGTQIIPKPTSRSFDQAFDQGPTMAEILLK